MKARQGLDGKQPSATNSLEIAHTHFSQSLHTIICHRPSSSTHIYRATNFHQYYFCYDNYFKIQNLLRFRVSRTSLYACSFAADANPETTKLDRPSSLCTYTDVFVQPSPTTRRAPQLSSSRRIHAFHARSDLSLYNILTHSYHSRHLNCGHGQTPNFSDYVICHCRSKASNFAH